MCVCVRERERERERQRERESERVREYSTAVTFPHSQSFSTEWLRMSLET